jgi:hypothetical protein
MSRSYPNPTGCTTTASNNPTPRCNAMNATTTKATATTAATTAASGGSLLQTISALLEQLAQLQNLLGVEPCGAPPRPAGRRAPATTGRGCPSSASRRCRPTPAPAPAASRWQDAPFCADDTDPTDSWDWPWDQMSVVELRALLRCYPIDRTALPAPIELLRRDELLAALHELQPDPQDLFGG